MNPEKIKIIDSGAEMDGNRTHRYSLWRTWNYDLPRIMFIGLNPSRADADFNDPTITRCINFAHGFGFGSMYFANLFSYRTPYVFAVPDKLNKENWTPLIHTSFPATNTTDDFLIHMINKSEKIVCCWGSWPGFIGVKKRVPLVLQLIENAGKEPHCFGTNKDGQPKHPLYLKSTTQLIPFFYERK